MIFNIKVNIKKLAVYSSISFFLLFFILRIFLVFSYSADIGGIENNVIYSICKTIYGIPLYSDPEQGNYDITQYTPLYYNFIIFICKILSVNPLDDLHSIYIIGRSVSLLLNIAGGIIIFGLLSKKFKIPKSISIISSSIYFLFLTRIQFAARPDSLFSFLFILSISILCLFFIEENKKKRTVYFFAGLSIASLSIFAKQTGIELLVFIPGFFLLTKDFKRFLLSAITLISVTAFLYAFFSGIYGESFLKHSFGGINNGVIYFRAYDVFSHFFATSTLIFIAGTICSVLFFQKRRSTVSRFLSYTILFLFFFAFVTTAKEGSWINYYNEYIIAVLILSAIEINNLSHHFTMKDAVHRTALWSLVSAIILIMPVMILNKLFHEHFNHLKDTKTIFLEKQTASKEIRQILDQNNGAYFLSFDADINCMLADRSIVPQKDIVPALTKFDYTGLYNALENGMVRYIILKTGEEPNSFLGKDFKDFSIRYDDGKYKLLENKSVKRKLPV